MPQRRQPKAADSPSAIPNASTTSTTDFPYFQYISLLGTLTLLLSFTGVFLPASTTLFTTLPPQQSSLDKPQHRLLVPITASPIWTMIWLCAGTAACQAWWAGWMRNLWACYPRLGFVKLSEDEERLLKNNSDKIIALRNAWTNTLIISALFHLIIVALGAPITSFVPQTYTLALFLSLLTTFVPSYALSLPTLSPMVFFSKSTDSIDLRWLASIRLFGQRRMDTPMERSLVFPVIASLVGSWVGAFAIALDWDRPWQAWPLTPAYGALVGYLLGAWSSFGINVMLYFASQDQSYQASTETGTLKRKEGKKKV